ncbi:coth protein-domain-containing protein [Syncephalastrum racemosum]|uniref:Coth protein-domain-containing protein n=1 Tax=Syncephalastrum racemosum TaxID=13706 RepID=A0A1X2HFZ1_SYNRA|nr:coth protein-domain-containing protein [Syncephalastrum racemosum]
MRAAATVAFALWLCACVHAATYKVVGVSQDSHIAVRVQDQIYVLKTSIEDSLLHEGVAPGNKPYHYCLVKQDDPQSIVDEENFDRPAIGANATTENEIYGRSWTRREVDTFKPIQSLPQNRYNRVHSDRPTDQIPVIHVVGPQDEIDKIHNDYLLDISTQVNMTFISASQFYQFSDVKFKLGGRTSRYYTRPAYNLKLPKGSRLFGFRKLKIRTLATDPSCMREKLAFDMIEAAGLAASRAYYVRVYMNQRAAGLFMLEEKYEDHWLEAEYGGGSDSYKWGPLYRGEGRTKKNAADLSYHGNDTTYYSKQAPYTVQAKAEVGPTVEYNDLVAFTKFIDDQLKNATASIGEWNKYINLDVFLINNLFEFFNGFCDGYLQNTNNYYLYANPAEDFAFTWISWDLDYVMGSGYVHFSKLIKGNYSEFPGVQKRPLTKALQQNAAIRQRTNDLMRTLHDNLYSPSVSFPVIDSHVAFIKEDVAWFNSLKPMRSGVSFIPGIGPNPIGNLAHNNVSGDSISTPLSLDLITAADYMIRIQKKISLEKAVEGPTHHRSLWAIKQWFKEKSDNVQKYMRAHT